MTERPSEIGKPVVGLDVLNGLAWNNGPECPIVLMDRYKTLNRSVDALISSVCPPAY